MKKTNSRTKKTVKKSKVVKKTIKHRVKSKQIKSESKQKFSFGIYLEALKESLKSFKKSIWLAPFPILADILLIFVSGIVFGLFKENLMGSMFSIMNIFAANKNIISEYAAEGILSQTTATFQAAFNMMLGVLFKLWLVLFLVWVLTQGISWYFAHRINGSEIKFFSFLGKFLIFSTAAGVLLSVIITKGIKLIFSVMFSMSQVINFDSVKFLVFVLMGLVAYLLLIAYSAIELKLKDMVKLAFKRIHFVLLGMVLVGVVAYIISMLLTLIPNFIVGAIVSVLVVLPLFLLIRIYLINLMQKLDY